MTGEHWKVLLGTSQQKNFKCRAGELHSPPTPSGDPLLWVNFQINYFGNSHGKPANLPLGHPGSGRMVLAWFPLPQPPPKIELLCDQRHKNSHLLTKFAKNCLPQGQGILKSKVGGPKWRASKVRRDSQCTHPARVWVQGPQWRLLASWPIYVSGQKGPKKWPLWPKNALDRPATPCIGTTFDLQKSCVSLHRAALKVPGGGRSGPGTVFDVVVNS